MNIPDSILAQSEARAGDPFVPSRVFTKKDPKEIYDFLRYNLNDEKLSKLKAKNINTDFLNLF